MAPIDLKWEKWNKSSLEPFIRHIAYIYYVAMFSGTLHESCQSSTLGPNWQCRGVICSYYRLVIKTETMRPTSEVSDINSLTVWALYTYFSDPQNAAFELLV